MVIVTILHLNVFYWKRIRTNYKQELVVSDLWMLFYNVSFLAIIKTLQIAIKFPFTKSVGVTHTFVLVGL